MWTIKNNRLENKAINYTSPILGYYTIIWVECNIRNFKRWDKLHSNYTDGHKPQGLYLNLALMAQSESLIGKHDEFLKQLGNYPIQRCAYKDAYDESRLYMAKLKNK